MRGGPSTGMPTRPAQADIMQTRWGSHGDYPIIVLAPASVREIYDETIRAFDLAETYRTPVIVLYDQAIAQLTETVELHPGKGARAERKWASGPRETFQPYATGDDGIPAMSRPGAGYRTHTTGLTHSETGFPSQNPEVVERNLTRLLTKLDKHRAVIDSSQSLACEDAEVLIVTVGISARAATRAVELARSRGVKAGLFRPITLWPFPEQALRDAAARVRAVLVPEMNAGQLQLEVERILGSTRVHGMHRINGEPIAPEEIAVRVEALVKEQQ
jgi:2-oxoglutarate ferredoxin oxidoreductase subunit alpha